MASPTDTKKDGDNVRGPLKDLYKNDAPSTYTYPMDLGSTDDPYLVFRRVKYQRKKRLDLSKRRVLSSIYLPIPANLGVQYGVNYTNVDLGIVGNQVSKIDVSSDSDFLEQAVAVGQKVLDPSFLSSQLVPRAAKNTLETIGNVTGTNAFTGAQLATGKAMNSHLAALFEDVGFRSHEFSYKMIARNEQESREIRNMIQIFKYAMHPAKSYSGNVFEYPDEWYIHFRKGYRENLYDFAPCVLTNFSVQYNGSNVPVFFEDTKAPVDIDITLQFQEVQVITKEEIEKEYTNRGAFGQISE